MSDEELVRDIAVIGMAGRFPGSRDLKQLWQNLRDGRESVTLFSDEELAAAGVPREHLEDPRYVKAGSRLADVDRFDAGFFGYAAREAEILDPQHRLFLEEAWAALENAGHAPGRFDGLIGVYAGVAWNTYLLRNLATHPELFAGPAGFQLFITNDKDFLPTRVSYKLDLKGPSLLVQTSCSTSLVATHLACLSLLNYECDLALAGGVTVRVPQDEGYFYQEGGLASPDGHCRSFDAAAAGTIFGSGVGVVALRRLADALADGDPIRAVIKASAINNDGAVKVSYTAPSVAGQAEVIAAAQALGGIDPRSLQMVEAHGTATSLGDPIEVTALSKVFRESTADRGFCALGSVKSNFGHLDAAAGIAGLIKTVLALEHREIPPSLHFERPNPALELAESPFYVNAALRPWEAAGGPRRAGVSSFGVGGTNAHVIVEEAPAAPPPAPAARPHQLLLLSARTAAALERATDNLAAALAGREDAELPDIAFTLHAGRTAMPHRRALVAASCAVARDLLARRDPERLAGAVSEREAGAPVAFLFPGEGGEPLAAAGALYRGEAVFRAAYDRAAELLRPHLGLDLRNHFGDPAPDSEMDGPARFALAWALSELFRAWGIASRATLGAGAGELAASAVAGALPLERAAELAVRSPARAEKGLAERLGEILADPDVILLEMGTGGSLAALAAGHSAYRGQPVFAALPAGTPADAGVVAALGRLWLAGCEPDPAGFHGPERRRVELPSYPFERQRFWIEAAAAPAESARPAASPTERRPAAEWLYRPAWRPAQAPAVESQPADRRWVIVASGAGFAARLAGRLRADGAPITHVEGPPAEGWQALVDEAVRSGEPTTFVHALSLGVGAAGADGFAGLLGLAQALAAAEGKGAPCELAVLADGLAAVAPGEPLAPEKAPLLGLLRVLPLEHPRISCRALDLALPPPGSRREGRLAGRVIAELGAPAETERVAFRGERRFVPEYEPCPVGEGMALREGGVYAVLGGPEGMAGALSAGLARRGARVARLLPALPGATAPGPQRFAPETAEGSGLTLTVDLADAAALAAALDRAEAVLGPLAGVFHAVEVTGPHALSEVRHLDAAALAPHLTVRGSLPALAAAVAGRDLDFCAALSTLASVLGGTAFAAAAAAGCFVDAFAEAQSGAAETPWWSLGMDLWQTAAEAPAASGRSALAMTAEEGVAAVLAALALPGAGHVLVSTADLPARLAERRSRLARLAAGSTAEAGVAERTEYHPRPLATPFVAPEGDLEERIAAVWKRVLGFDPIGAHDNFFELGGDSFLALQVVAGLRQALGLELPVARLYQGLTVRALAELLGRDEAAAARAFLEERQESASRRRDFQQRRRADRRAEGRDA